jgi:ribonuclease-3
MVLTPQGEIEIEPARSFVKRVELPFTDFLLLNRALTHRSYINEHPEALEDNERLEFLGDAVLDFLVGAWLYKHFPEMAEGDLTRLRAALVCTEQLAEFARQIDLGAAMKLGRGEGDGGGRNRNALLCGTFEALVGALYLDAGIEAVQEFMEPMLQHAASSILEAHKDRDAKSLLQELVQSKGYAPPVYNTVSDRGPDHKKTFEVVVFIGGQEFGRGSGHSKQSAAKVAARKAIDKFGLSQRSNDAIAT